MVITLDSSRKKEREMKMRKAKRKSRDLDYITWYNNQNYDRVTIIVPKGTRANIKEEAKRQGKSTNEFLIGFIPKQLIAERVFVGRTEG